MFHRSWCFSPVNFTANRSISGEQLLKQGFLRERLGACRSLYRKDLFGHYGCVNAIEFSNHGGDFLISGGKPGRYSDIRCLNTWIISGNFDQIISPSAMLHQWLARV
ncbi:DDB1- and CUL4-associated factor 5 [Branchiostoma belcheri]|nr:DDB1- and CUL4-associated factor 5 [Branchiostoma belcheri]